MACSEQSDSTRGVQLPTLPHDHKLVTLPPPPVDFFNYPVFPPKVSFLAELNYHARDQNLSFRLQDHTYFIHGTQSLGSVTGLIASHTYEFDADAVITAMILGPRWPRPGYLKSSFDPSELEFLSSCPDATFLRDAVLRNDATQEEICQLAQSLMTTSPHLRGNVARLGKAAPEIKDMWEANRKEAASKLRAS